MVDRVRRRYASSVPTETPSPRKNDVLAEICRAIARSADPFQVVQECAVRLQRYFGTHAVLVFLEDEDELILAGLALPASLEHLASDLATQWEKAPFDGQRPSVQAMRQRRTVRRDATDPTLPAPMRELLRAGSASAVLAVPIYGDDEPIGACVVASPDGASLAPSDELLLQDALAIAAVVWQRGLERERELARQSQALRDQSLAALGELTTRVAHEINNPLTAIVHGAELLLVSDLTDEGRDSVRRILDEALRAAASIRRLQPAGFDATAPGFRAPSLEAPAVSHTDTVAPARPLTILLVEDEPQVARAIATLLNRDGHDVTPVASAEDALRELSAELPRYDVVLSDYRMPGMGGEGLFDFVRARMPGWIDRLVFMSGDLVAPQTQVFLESAGRPVLAKPFTLDALRRALEPFGR